ncbi:hypothetical protein [Bradyrhizobium elkanii]|uniref:hypothetical protein n=1 Tax=Bradyrhizobium elkanii TaxID=29448 RepID=UPI00054D0419|nr:hypothetical protein [Bradyrhizobium elkanii]
MPRRADVAVGVSQLMVDLPLRVYDHERYKQEYFSAALEQMFVALVIFSAAEGAGANEFGKIGHRLRRNNSAALAQKFPKMWSAPQETALNVERATRPPYAITLRRRRLTS